jgi:hypothetical protein
MLKTKKSIFIHLVLLFNLALISCTSKLSEMDSLDDENTSGSLSRLDERPIFERTAEQDSARKALNFLQRHTQGHLYSTFLNAQNPCYPPDTTFVINQIELQNAIDRIVLLYGEGLSPEERVQLPIAASIGEESYYVEQCLESEIEKYQIAFMRDIPSSSGTWLIRDLTGSDLILCW